MAALSLSRLTTVLGLVAALGVSGCTAAVVAVGVGAGAVAGSSSTEERGFQGAVDDSKIRATINHLWFQRDHVMFGNIHLQIYEGRVLLTGLAPTPEAKRTAVELSHRAAGVREVIDEIIVQDNTVGIDYSRDVVIANELRSKLLFDSEVRNVNYSVETVNGTVYLLGVARNRVEMDRVIGHAKNVEYVRRVANYILLADDPRRAAPPRP